VRTRSARRDRAPAEQIVEPARSRLYFFPLVLVVVLAVPAQQAMDGTVGGEPLRPGRCLAVVEGECVAGDLLDVEGAIRRRGEQLRDPTFDLARASAHMLITLNP
jgi:hypothetical protein